MHHDLRERFSGTLIVVHSMIKGREWGFRIGLKKRKKSFGETKKWITFAELSPEKIGVEEQKKEAYEHKKFIEDI